MRKLFVSVLSSAALLVCLSAFQAQAGTQTINLQNRLGSIDATLTIETNSMSLVGTAHVVATGKDYAFDAEATISGTPGHYTVSGELTISDGTTTKTYTFSCPGFTSQFASMMFVNKSIGLVLAQQPPVHRVPGRAPALSPE